MGGADEEEETEETEGTLCALQIEGHAERGRWEQMVRLMLHKTFNLKNNKLKITSNTILLLATLKALKTSKMQGCEAAPPVSVRKL